VIANVFLFYLQRHSDHHVHPVRRNLALCHADQAHQLLAGYATMMGGHFPLLWRRARNPRVLDHYRAEIHSGALSLRHEKRLLERYSAAISDRAPTTSKSFARTNY